MSIHVVQPEYVNTTKLQIEKQLNEWPASKLRLNISFMSMLTITVLGDECVSFETV